MKYINFNLLFMIIFINISCVLNANKLKIQNKRDCIEYTKENENEFVDKFFEDSKIMKNQNTTFFLFFSNKRDNFQKLKAIANPINKLLEGELKIIFFCENKNSKKNVTMDSDKNDINDILDFFVLKNGNLKKHETLNTFSKEFMAHMINEFNLTDYLEKRYLSNVEKNSNKNKFDNHEINGFIQLTLSLKKNENKSKIENSEIISNDELIKDKNNNFKATIDSSIKTNLLKINKHINESAGDTFNTIENLNKTAIINLTKDNTFEYEAKKEIVNDINLQYNNQTIILLKNTEDNFEAVKDSELNNSIQQNDQNLNFSKNKRNLEKKINLNDTVNETLDKKDNLISNSHSLKSTNQLRRNTEEGTYTSFLEKENIHFTDSVENSRIVSLQNQYIINLAQTNIKNLQSKPNENKNDILGEKSNRLGRFFLALFIVIISSLLCFMFVKYSIDWATKSKTELNSLRDRENREILEEINRNHNLIRFN